MEELRVQLPDGRKLGAPIGVEIDHSDGKTLWLFERCGGDTCVGSTIDPVMKLDANDGHGVLQGHQTNDRIVKLSKDGTFIMAWGKHGSAPGEFDVPHSLALDSAGLLYVGDRSNNRVQVFDQTGKFIAEWKQFGRPSSVYIDKNDTIYVADSQSDEKTNPGFSQGIRIGSVKDGKVAAFIPLTDPAIGSAEELAADDQGNVFAGFTAQGKMAVRKFVKN